MSAVLQSQASATMSAWLAAEAVHALLAEAELSPKPGLVDARGKGAHDDLDLGLMQRSARALEPGFTAMAQAAMSSPHADAQLREQLGAIGRATELAMLVASGGVNTHRGAIWALGLLIAAAAQRVGDWSPPVLAARAAALARLPDTALPQAPSPRKGDQACRQYGVSGARGEAQQGFPHVLQLALPQLWRSRSQGASEAAARLDALLAVMTRLDDTCVLSRGGHAGLARVQRGAAAVLAAGGCSHLDGRRALKELDRELLDNRLSPGGAADLLAAALLLDRLQGSAATDAEPINPYAQTYA